MIAFFAIAAQSVLAQDDADVLRYSQTQPGGTARSISLGGATGALGADFSNASNNPAGLGMYRTSELTFSPGIIGGSTTANYFANENQETKLNFGFGNFGLVMRNNYSTKGKPATKGWTGVTFAFGFNKLASFNNSFSYSGYNRASSIGDKFEQDLSGKGITSSNALNSNPWGAGLAYDAYLLDAHYPDSTNYTALNAGGNVQQTATATTTGALNEMTLSFAGSWENRLFLGGTLGVPFVNYTQNTDYYESDDSLKHTGSGFKSFEMNQNITTTGAGINLKLGALYLVNDYLRFGLAIHSPTYYSLKDDATISMTTVRGDSAYAGTYTSSSTANLNYNITTPWRFIASTSLLFKKFGFINVDYELVDYSSASISYQSSNVSDVQAQNAVNNYMRNNYNSTSSNIRIGAELKLDIFSLRAGYAYYSSPFKKSVLTDFDQSRNVISFGAGVRERDYFIDLGYQRTMNSSVSVPYQFASGSSLASPLATLSTNKSMFIVTVGFKF